MLTDLPLQYIGIVLATMLISIPIHEAAHGYIAHKLGDSTAAEEGRLTLNPLKHIDLWMTIALPALLLLIGAPPIFVAKPVPFDPRNLRHEEFGVALVGIAGPLTNLGLAAVAALAARIIGIDMSSSLGVITGIFITINVALFVFNMLPIPPLDGSRLLYAFAPEPLQRLLLQIESFGIIVILVILLVLSPIILPFVNSITHSIVTFLLL